MNQSGKKFVEERRSSLVFFSRCPARMESLETWVSPPTDRRSDVWKNLLVSSANKNKVKCRHCCKIFNYHSSTTSMKYHMQQKHGIDAPQPGSSGETTPAITAHFPAVTKDTPEKVRKKLKCVFGRSCCIEIRT